MRPAPLLIALFLSMAALPLLGNEYAVSLLILFLFQAYLGMSWNVMMGFAGQFSLGHALYLGLGAYAGAAAYVHFGLPPWAGMIVGGAVAALVGAGIGALGFRFGVKGVYFALLTIAFSEFTRILFDHWTWIGASSGIYMPVANRTGNDVWMLRGSNDLFYYVILGMCSLAFLLSAWLMRTRTGYFWMAIREDQEAAETLGVPVFRMKILAVMVSAALTSAAGVFYVFYNNNIYPENIFSMHRSIELMLGAIIGGIGTLFGPILGAAVLTIIGELLNHATEGMRIDGLKQVAYGLCLLIIVGLKPEGLWPWLYRRLKLGARR